MGLFSFLRKNKQDPASGDGEFYSRAEEASTAVRGRGKRKDNQANDRVDPVLPEKKRARRRLVGAIALVLAAIVGLPMIFDSEPKPVADDIAIHIPSKDSPVKRELGAERPESASLPKAHISTSTEVKQPDHSTATAVAGAERPTDSAKDVEVEKASTQASSKATPKTEQKTVQKPEVKAGVKIEPKSTASHSVAIKAPEKKNGKFALQVAALSTKAKIDELQETLKKAGFTTFTQKVATASGVSTRIRVGPYASKEEADRARAKLIMMGLNGTHVPMGH